MDSIEALARYVRDVAKTDRYGGHCMPVDGARCILWDCGTWTTRMHAAVRARFHTCSITVSPSDSSVSGFVVIFELQTLPSRLLLVAYVAAAAAAMAIGSVYAYRALAPALPLSLPPIAAFVPWPLYRSI